MGITALPYTAVLAVPSNRLLGNDNGTTGPAEALTAAEVRTLLSVYTTTQVDTLLAGKAAIVHPHDASDITSGTLNILRIPTGTTSTTVCIGNDSRLSDARTPLSHTHSQSDITGLSTTLAAKADLVGGLVPAAQLPSYVDDVLEYANLAAFPATGEAGKIYVALDTNRTYRWGGSTYAELTDSTAVWGSISGTLSNQTDLVSALSGKSDTGHTHAYSSLTGIPSTFAPSAHKTSHATGGTDALAPSDIGAVPTSRTLTINGTAFDLSANRSWTVSGGIGGSTGSVDNALLRADGTGGATAQASGATLSDTSEMIIGDATNAGKFRLQDSGQYTTTNLLSVYLGGIYIGQNIATFTVKGDGEVYSYKGYTCNTSGNGFTGHQFVFDGGWGAITRGGSTPTGNGNKMSSAGAWNINCATSNGVSITSNSGASPAFLQVYNISTSTTSFERLGITWTSNICTIETEKGSAGGTLRGLRIGGSSSALVGFWGATPIAQPTTAVASATRVGGGGAALTDTDTFDGYTISQFVRAMRLAGIIQ